MYYYYSLSNALVNNIGHNSDESTDLGNNEYLLSVEHGSLSSISTFTYYPMKYNLTQYLPDLLYYGILFYDYGYIL